MDFSVSRGSIDWAKLLRLLTTGGRSGAVAQACRQFAERERSHGNLAYLDHACFIHAMLTLISDVRMALKQLRLDDQLCFALYAATNAVTRSYKPKLAKIGITYPQYILLLALWQDGPRTISDIARRLKLPANGITPVIDRLEAAGLVVRCRDLEDRRVISIHLTAEGVALEDEAARAQFSVVCETQLDGAALQALRQELHAMVQRMENFQSVGGEI